MLVRAPFFAKTAPRAIRPTVIPVADIAQSLLLFSCCFFKCSIYFYDKYFSLIYIKFTIPESTLKLFQKFYDGDCDETQQVYSQGLTAMARELLVHPQPLS